MDELYYSRVLAKILDPKTPVIGNREYLKKFFDLLCKINGNIKPHEFSNDIEVKREKDNIDIAIYDNKKKYAIIIENKIKNAPDQDNQLGRYYDTVCKKSFKPLAVVYLTPHKDKKPDFKSYSKDYREKLENIQSIFVHLLAFDPNDKLDLAHGFLDECVEITKDKENGIPGIFIGQFSKLVQYTGGLEAMSKIYQKQVLEAIYSDYNHVEIAQEIAEIWTGKNSLRQLLLGEIFLDKLYKKLGHDRIDKDRNQLIIKTKFGVILNMIHINKAWTKR